MCTAVVKRGIEQATPFTNMKYTRIIAYGKHLGCLVDGAGQLPPYGSWGISFAHLMAAHMSNTDR